MVLGRIEFWGGSQAVEFRCRLIREHTAPPRELRAMRSIEGLVAAALGLESAPTDLIPEFDEAELHRRNADAVRRNHHL
jgi:hypothetical protein